MIIKEFFGARRDRKNLFRTFSDRGVKIRKIGTDEIYDEAIDVESAKNFYEETDEKIENDRSEN